MFFKLINHFKIDFYCDSLYTVSYISTDETSTEAELGLVTCIKWF